jgi:hypothetical protein
MNARAVPDEGGFERKERRKYYRIKALWRICRRVDSAATRNNTGDVADKVSNACSKIERNEGLIELPGRQRGDAYHRIANAPIPPTGQPLPNGRVRALVLYGDLVEAVMHFWGVGKDTVWLWRKALE